MLEIVNCTNSDGFTPLHLASSEGHAPLIEILIKFKAQVDARTNNFRTPLHIACLRGNLSVIQALIQHGADINAKDIDSNTPCHFCSEYGHRFCLKFLLTRNPYLFANNNEDKSAIDVAISSEILNVSITIIFSILIHNLLSLGIPRIYYEIEGFLEQEEGRLAAIVAEGC